jgi:hypothetical protein
MVFCFVQEYFFRTTRELEYFVFLEYSCEVWDSCGQMNADRLEKINLEAARIITGLTIYSSKESYRETGWGNSQSDRNSENLFYFTK